MIGNIDKKCKQKSLCDIIHGIGCRGVNVQGQFPVRILELIIFKVLFNWLCEQGQSCFLMMGPKDIFSKH